MEADKINLDRILSQLADALLELRAENNHLLSVLKEKDDFLDETAYTIGSTDNRYCLWCGCWSGESYKGVNGHFPGCSWLKARHAGQRNDLAITTGLKEEKDNFLDRRAVEGETA